jgi:hypothetical protein
MQVHTYFEIWKWLSFHVLEYDQEGIPTLTADGGQVSQSQLKKFRKLQHVQMKKEQSRMGKANNETATTQTQNSPPTSLLPTTPTATKSEISGPNNESNDLSEQQSSSVEKSRQPLKKGVMYPLLVVGTFGNRQGLRLKSECGPFTHMFEF